MTRHNKIKINKLLKALPRGSVLTTTWLKQQGVSNKLAWWYVKAGWLERISDGAYLLSGDTITWASAVAATQEQLHIPLHLGAKTALQLLGKSHYLSTKLQEIQLFSSPNHKLPAWLHSSYWKESFKLYCPALFSPHKEDTLISRDINGLTLKLSSPERAALELCYLVPNTVTFSEAALILEGLTRMRPKQIQWLLEHCQSFKAKRLFLYLAEYFDHSWMSEINLNHIDLGKGKRVIAGGGEYNDKYKISVPPLREK